MLIKFIPSYKSVYNFSFQNQIQESKVNYQQIESSKWTTS